MKNNKLKKYFKLDIVKRTSMNKFSKRGIFLTIAILFSMSLMLIPTEVYATDKIDTKIIGIENTSIISITNNSNENVKMFRIWLGDGVNFESFKTEEGWIGEKTPQGVIVFTTSESIKFGESVKFGIKTDEKFPTINWKALEEGNTVIDTGFTTSSKIEKVIKNPDLQSNQNTIDVDGEIFSESDFKIVPEKPNSGSTIRVTGSQFGPSQVFDFYLDSNKLSSFYTDETGSFITTVKIPDGQSDKRVDFKIKNSQGQEKIKSLRLGEGVNLIPQSENIKITIEGIKNIFGRGEIIELSGTAKPGSAVTIKITNPSDLTVNSRTADVDRVGNWELIEDINIPFDAEFGKYNIIVSDGRNQILKSYNIESNKIILINPTKQMFEAGELIKFNGTATPNVKLELSLEDQLGEEVISDIIMTDNSGFMEYQYQTIENDDKVGTWTLIITQGEVKEFVYVGYDVVPSVPINLEFDKSNYQSTETAIISLVGKPSETVQLMIINPSGSIVGTDIPIQLQADGRAIYELDLAGYGSGMYTSVVKKGGSQSSETFTVGLSMGSGPIDANTTQTEYEEGERILLLGNTNPNSLLTGQLIDPNGSLIKKLEIASNNRGVFSEEGFRIPSNPITGTWKIVVSSGGNLDQVEFNVFANNTENMIVKIKEGLELPGYGDSIKIMITASHKTSINIEIINSGGEVIDKTLKCNTTSAFKCEIYHPISNNMLPGTYTVRASDAISSGEATFEVN